MFWPGMEDDVGLTIGLRPIETRIGPTRWSLRNRLYKVPVLCLASFFRFCSIEVKWIAEQVANSCGLLGTSPVWPRCR